MRRTSIVSAIALVLGLLVVTAPAAVQAADGTTAATDARVATSTRTVLYGPFTIPAGTMGDPGMVHDKLLVGVRRACTDCFITSFTPDLVYGDGTRATMETGPMLHHAVWTNQWRQDATCSQDWLGLAGERFFASGDERTPITLPSGYGYRSRWYDSWNLLVDLMNHSAVSRTVYVKLTVTYRPSWEDVDRVRPVWLDIDQCGDSEYSIPAGWSDTHRDWKVTVPGKVVAMLGHVHGHGVSVEATNESRGGESICLSRATLDPMDAHRVAAMSTCSADPVAVLHRDDVVRLHSTYDSPHSADDVMGIMLGYVRPQ